MPEATDETQRIRAYYRDASWRPSPGRSYLVSEWTGLVESVLAERGSDLSATRVCDVGCGAGSDLRRWKTLGVPEAQLSGTELSPERAEAAQRALPDATIARVDSFEVPFGDGAFDLVTASLVFSSVIDSDGRKALAAEMRRVTRPGGLIAVYDFRIRKPWNRHVRPVHERDLASSLGPSWRRYAVSPFLPLLDITLRLPSPIARRLMRVLPRTHRVWMWRA